MPDPKQEALTGYIIDDDDPLAGWSAFARTEGTRGLDTFRASGQVILQCLIALTTAYIAILGLLKAKSIPIHSYALIPLFFWMVAFVGLLMVATPWTFVARQDMPGAVRSEYLKMLSQKRSLTFASVTLIIIGVLSAGFALAQ